MSIEEPVWSNMEQYLDSLEEGTELSLVLWASGHAQVNFIRENTKKHAKTVFASYTTPNGFRGSVPLFKFKIKKETKKKQNRFPFKIASFEINTGIVKIRLEPHDSKE